MTHRAPASLFNCLLKTCLRRERDEIEITQSSNSTFLTQHLALTPLRFVRLATLLGEGGDAAGKNLRKLQPKVTSFFKHFFITEVS